MNTFVTDMGNRLPVPSCPPCEAPSSVMDGALAEQAAHAGRMLEIAYRNGDREAALIWQRAMFDLVKLRRVRRFGSDTHAAEGVGR